MAEINPALASSGPPGASIEFDGRRIAIEPSSLSGKSIRAYRRIMADLKREEVKRLLLDKKIPRHVREMIIRESIAPTSVGQADVILGLQIPEFLREVLYLACPAETRETIDRLVDEYPVYDELMEVVFISMGFATLKNSAPPATTQNSETPGNEQAS